MLVLSAPSDVSLTQLLSASCAEREAAWSRVYRRHFEDVCRLALRCGVSPADVEDVTQRVFMVAQRRIRDIDELTSVGGWLRGITLRVAADYRRWRHVRKAKAWVLRWTTHADTGVMRTPEHELELLQAQQLVAEILNQMSPKLREVLVLVDIDEVSVEEAAKILGIPQNTIRSRRRLAREKFDQILGRRMNKEGRNP